MNTISSWICSFKNEQEYYHLAEARQSLFAAAFARQSGLATTIASPNASFPDFNWTSSKSKPTIPLGTQVTTSNDPLGSSLGVPPDHFHNALFYVNSWSYVPLNTQELNHLSSALHSIEAAAFVRANPGKCLNDFHWTQKSKSKNTRT